MRHILSIFIYLLGTYWKVCIALSCEIHIAQQTFTWSKSTKETVEKRCEISSKLIKTPEQLPCRCSGFYTVNFENISYLFLTYLLLTLNR